VSAISTNFMSLTVTGNKGVINCWNHLSSFIIRNFILFDARRRFFAKYHVDVYQIATTVIKSLSILGW